MITRYPIWLAEEAGVRTLALPDESPADVLDLARSFPGTKLVITASGTNELWPAIAATDPIGITCFRPVPLSDPGDGRFDGLRVFEIVCP